MFGRGSRATSGAAVAAGEVGGEAHVACSSHMSGAQPTLERHHKTQPCTGDSDIVLLLCNPCSAMGTNEILFYSAFF